MKTLVLIDGSSYIYRAYYALPKFTTSKGFPTNAIYGFINMLKKLMRNLSPDYMGVAFDMKAPTFRHRKFKEYKITRKPMPESLSRQVPIIKDIIKGYRIPIFEEEGYEAEDIMAVIANQAKVKGLCVYLVTSDKDVLQLVDDSIYLYHPQREEIIDQEKIKEQYGVSPKQIPDLLALMGDSIDNIPGLPGIGEKTAQQLIKNFGGVKDLLADIDKLPPKIADLIRENKDRLLLSLELAKIKADIHLAINWEELKLKEPEVGKLILIYEKLEFKSLLRELLSCSASLKDIQCQEISPLELFKLKKQLLQSDYFSFYISGEKNKPRKICLQINGKSYLIQGMESAKDVLKELFSSPQIIKVTHNLKRQLALLENIGITSKKGYFDIEVASYLLDPSCEDFSIFRLALNYFPQEHRHILNLMELGKKQEQGFNKEDEKLLALATQYLEKLYPLIKDELAKNNLLDLYNNIELPLIFVLFRMEKNGIRIDLPYLRELSQDYERKTNKIKLKIYEIAGKEFNLNSPRQLAELLYQKLKLKPLKRTKTGLSTDEESLRHLSEQHPLPKLILEYRQLAKLKSTYIDAILNLIKQDGKIHASFNQTVTQTGRLSSSNPNLQNIPIRSELGRMIRRAFIPDKNDWIFLSADYSQIELRILAHLSQDEKLLQAFRQGRDIHRHTASLIFGVDEEIVSSEMRDIAKTVNFGIIYGISDFGLSRQLGIAQPEALKFIKNYFSLYPGVKLFIERKIAEAKKKGKVATLLGRMRKITEINSSDVNLREFGERLAINTPIQGSAADIIKKAMVEIQSSIDEKKLPANILIQIHDELLFEVKEQRKWDLIDIIYEKMENVLKLSVPLVVKIKEGKNWLEMEEIERRKDG